MASNSLVLRTLIGEDKGLLIANRDRIHGNWKSPIASRTWLGWTLSGNHAYAIFLSVTFAYNETELVKSSFQINDIIIKTIKLRSKEEEMALEIMTNTTRRWKTGLIWKNQNIKLPDSKYMEQWRMKNGKETRWLTGMCPAFTFTCIDYFGSISVKVGRRLKKRYGALFMMLFISKSPKWPYENVSQDVVVLSICTQTMEPT